MAKSKKAKTPERKLVAPTITYRELRGAIPVMKKLSNHVFEDDVVLGLRIHRLIRQIDDHLDDFNSTVENIRTRVNDEDDDLEESQASDMIEDLLSEEVRLERVPVLAHEEVAPVGLTAMNLGQLADLGVLEFPE